jgi:hypothetical protein
VRSVSECRCRCGEGARREFEEETIMKVLAKRRCGVCGAKSRWTLALVAGAALFVAERQGLVAAVAADAAPARGAAFGVPASIEGNLDGDDGALRAAIGGMELSAGPGDLLVSERGPDTAYAAISCCSVGGACSMIAGSCPSGTTSVKCPCLPPV